MPIMLVFVRATIVSDQQRLIDELLHELLAISVYGVIVWTFRPRPLRRSRLDDLSADQIEMSELSPPPSSKSADSDRLPQGPPPPLQHLGTSLEHFHE